MSPQVRPEAAALVMEAIAGVAHPAAAATPPFSA
jgi:hypothetical protein